MNIVDVFPRKFFTYDVEDEVEFGDGLTVIVGPNGAGKTALGLEAICWTLWGRTTRGTVPDGEVAVRFRPGDGELYEVHRLRKGKRAGSLNLCKLFDAAEGVVVPTRYEMTGQTSAETQSKIDALVGTWERFCAERVFSNRLRARFGLATDKERKALLEAVLGLERHERAAKLGRAELGVRKDKLGAVRTDMAAARAAHEQAKRALDSIDRGIGESVESLREALEDHKAKVARLEAEQVKLETVAREGAARAATLGKTRDEVGAAAKDLVARRERAGKDLAAVEARAKAAADMGDCPVCMTPATAIPRDKLAAHFEGDIVRLRQEVTDLTAELETSRAEYADLAEDARRFTEAAHRARDAANAAFQASQAAARDTRLERALAGEERRAEVEAGAQAEVGRCATLLEEAGEGEAAAERACLEAEAVVEALGSKGARVARMDAALAALQDEAAGVLARLPVDDAGVLGLRVSGRRELAKGGSVDEVSIEVIGAGGGEYDGTSDGERARVDVALMLGMSRVAGGEGLLVFDEIFDPLDGAALEAVAEIITELAQRRQVVVITHNPRFLDLLPSQAAWRIRREGGTSRVSRAA